MTTYFLGIVVLVLIVVPPAWAAVVVRGRLLPGWSGPPARLVELILWAAQVTAVPAIMGSVGLFRRWWLVIGLTIVAVALAALTPDAAERTEPVRRPARRFDVNAAAAIGALLTGPWVVSIWQTMRFGTQNYDSLSYHLPFAARWAQTGSTWHLEQVFPSQQAYLTVPYHPLSGEMLHALGMVAFRSDVLSPFVNIFWLGLLGVAAWCIGAPRGRGPHALVLALVAANCPLMLVSQPATAMTDLAFIAVCVAAVALVVQGVAVRVIAVPLGITLGLAAGVKLDALAPVAVLFVGAVVLAARPDRLVAAARILVPALVVGGFWYLRDFVAVGNPIPAVNLPLFTRIGTASARADDFAVVHYATNTSIIRHWFFPGLRIDFGTLWPLWLLAAVGGIIALLIWPPSSAYRLAAVAAAASCLAYLVTPTSAFGPPNHPGLFLLNVRYAMLAIVLGGAFLAVVPRLAGRRQGRALLAIAGLAAVGILASPVTWPKSPELSTGWRSIGWLVSLGAAGVVLAFAAMRGGRPVSRQLVVSGVAGAGLAGILGGYAVQDHWLPHQYTELSQFTPALAWGRTIHHARIAFLGLDFNYPLIGSDLSNYVQYLGVDAPRHEFNDPPTCQVLRTTLNRGRYDYVVFAVVGRAGPVPTQDTWVQGATGAVRVLTTPSATAYRVTRPLDPTTCKG